MNPKEKAELAEQLAWLHEQNKVRRELKEVTLPPRRKAESNNNSQNRGQYLTKKMKSEMSEEAIQEHYRKQRAKSRRVFNVKRECRLISSFNTNAGTRVFELKIERKHLKAHRRFRTLEEAIAVRDDLDAQYKALIK